MNIADLIAGATDAWRLEARDTYSIPDEQEDIEEWRRTGRVPPAPEWEALIRAAVARGASVGRVRLVGWPINEYTRYELDAYADNIASGEDVRIVDRLWLDATWDLAPDFWLIDGHVYLMRYDDAGRFLGVEEQRSAALYVRYRQSLALIAVPVADYRSFLASGDSRRHAELARQREEGSAGHSQTP